MNITRRVFLKLVTIGAGTLTGGCIFSKLFPDKILEIYKSLGGRELNPNIVSFFWDCYIPENYKDYITPDEVKEYAEKIKYDFDPPFSVTGRINAPKELKFEYKTDKELFGKKDWWQKPREYFKEGAIGDCDDYSLAMASISEAKGYETRVVGGYIKYERDKPFLPHWNVEIQADIEYYVLDVESPKTIKKRDYFYKWLREWGGEWKPLIMFGKNSKLQVYDKWW